MREFQTKSQSQMGKYSGLHYFATLSEAMDAASEDSAIYKISFDVNGESKCLMRKTFGNKWSAQCEAKMNKLNKAYATCKDSTQYFWVDYLNLHDYLTGRARSIYSEIDNKYKREIALAKANHSDLLEFMTIKDAIINRCIMEKTESYKKMSAETQEKISNDDEDFLVQNVYTTGEAIDKFGK